MDLHIKPDEASETDVLETFLETKDTVLFLSGQYTLSRPLFGAPLYHFMAPCDR